MSKINNVLVCFNVPVETENLQEDYETYILTLIFALKHELPVKGAVVDASVIIDTLRKLPKDSSQAVYFSMGDEENVDQALLSLNSTVEEGDE